MVQGGVGASGVIVVAEPLFWRQSRNSWLRAVSWPPEHVNNGSKLCLLRFLSNIDFFSGRFRNVILFRIYQYLISHKKSRIRCGLCLEVCAWYF